MGAQIIEKEGVPEYAVLTYDEYQSLLQRADDRDDHIAFDRAMAELAGGRDEAIPHEVAKRLLDGENPIRVWRQFRNLTQDDLGDRAGVGQSEISMIETGVRAGRQPTLRSIARALGVGIGDLLWERDSSG